MRVWILLMAAIMFGGIGVWAIWLAVSVAAQWAMMSLVTLGVSAVFFSIAANEA